MTRGWMVVRVRPNLLARAIINMERQDYECYAPYIRVRVKGRWRRAAMFPGYAFARARDGRWRSLGGTLGVLEIIMSAGEAPARIPDEEITRLRGREGEDGLIHLDAPPLSRGDPVQVAVRGAGLLDAIYDGMSGRDREFVLLKILGRWTRTEVRAEDLRHD